VRGPATLTGAGAAPAHAGLAGLCPSGAISSGGLTIRLDQGRCVQCGRCVAKRPDLFAWSSGPGVAAPARQALVVPEMPETPERLAEARARLRRRTAALRRSVHLRHVDAGSDGTEEWEILALLNPAYDVHRLGVFFTASPRHADILLVTGAGTAGMAGPLRRAHEAMPEPKLVMAVGTDAVSGGLHGGGDGACGGAGGILPVDVWVPGSPPDPFSILYGILLAAGRLPGGAAAGPAPSRAGDGTGRRRR